MAHAGHHRGRRRCRHPAGDRGHAQRRRRRRAVPEPECVRQSDGRDRTSGSARAVGHRRAERAAGDGRIRRGASDGRARAAARDDRHHAGGRRGDDGSAPGSARRLDARRRVERGRRLERALRRDRARPIRRDRGPAGRAVGGSRGRVHRRRHVGRTRTDAAFRPTDRRASQRERGRHRRAVGERVVVLPGRQADALADRPGGHRRPAGRRPRSWARAGHTSRWRPRRWWGGRS